MFEEVLGAFLSDFFALRVWGGGDGSRLKKC